jgi:hypothetical protein
VLCLVAVLFVFNNSSELFTQPYSSFSQKFQQRFYINNNLKKLKHYPSRDYFFLAAPGFGRLAPYLERR